MPVKETHYSNRSLTVDETHILLQFKDWILSQPQIVNPNVGKLLSFMWPNVWSLTRIHFHFVLSETRFLTRFLRARGFDLGQACETYKRFVKMRDMYPHCYKQLDVMDPAIYDLMSRGYLFPLWERDALGRTVIFGRGAMFNQKYGHRPTDLFRSIMMTVETLLDDEENQRRGFVYIFDQEGVCLSEVTYLGVFEMQKLVRSGEVRIARVSISESVRPETFTALSLPSDPWWSQFIPLSSWISLLLLFSHVYLLLAPDQKQKALPIKHKEVHWLNIPPIIMTCFYLISSFLSEKLRKRLFLHKNLESLHESIPRSILPLEYGGIIPWKDMSDRWISTLKANRSRLLAMDNMRWDSDQHKSNSGRTHSISIFQTIKKTLSIWAGDFLCNPCPASPSNLIPLNTSVCVV